MKKILVLVAALASITAFAQHNNPTQKILIGFNFSPDYSFRTLRNHDGSSSSDLVTNNRNEIEAAKFGYTTGLHVCFNISPLLGIKTGIQYSNKGFRTKSQDLIYFPPAPASPTKAKTKEAYQYIGLPLKAQLSFGKGKVHLLTGFGFMTNFLLNVKHTVNLEYADGHEENKTQSTTSGFKKVDISPMISLGVDYTLSHKIHLLAEPTFRYGVIVTRDVPVTENLWSAGLNIGINYVLK